MSESKLKVQVLEGADNKLDLAKLEDVLKRKLIIPSYQRPYAWQTEDIEDIFQTIKTAKEDHESLCFFGSIILSQKSNGFGQEGYYIIDGQQRLSSFLLILRVILKELNCLLEELKDHNLSKQQIEKEIKLETQRKELLQVINTVNLTREQSNNDSEEKSILHFIKNGRDDNLPDHLYKKITIIKKQSAIRPKDKWPDPNNPKEFNKYIDKVLDFLDQILNKIRFCLISITGENSEDFAISLFNTLNTTGQPLTAFEVLKSELYKVDSQLSDKINDIQKKIIERYVFQRKKIVNHTGKLLLYLPLYRGGFKEDGYTLSDKKFKDQRGYLKQILKTETPKQIVEDIQIINDFYSQYWLDLQSLDTLFKEDDEQVCFQFLTELKHDRVLPIIFRFYQNNKESLRKCIKMCVAFSSLWRAFHDGGTSGIDNAYKDVSLNLKKTDKIESLNKKLKELFLKKLKPSPKKIQELKNQWLEKLKISPIYKNQKLSKFLLFIAYNKLHFEPEKGLEKKSGIDILTLYHWKHKDYKTIEHIIPKTDRQIISHIHTLGNLTLLPQTLNSALGNKPFSEKLKEYRQFCSTENQDKYPYLPIIKHLAHYNHFNKKEIEERSGILSQFIWQTLAEDWLGWKE